MNDRKLPCINTILLNRYMKEQDFEAARDEAIVAAQEAAMNELCTEDDVYEFACSLEMTGTSEENREAIAEKMRDVQRTQGYQSQSAALESLGRMMFDLIQDNRAYRAEQKFWDEQ